MTEKEYDIVVDEKDMGELIINYMQLYGININLQRAIPMVQDGLKPITRRIMYIMYKHFRNSKVKVSVAMGQVETIHPHGDLGLGAIFAHLAQTFSNNVTLLSTADTGNSGNIVAGNDFAAPRYLEVVMSKFAKEILFDEFDGKSNMILSYDDSTYEPLILPAKFPLILLNGIAGIGYTLATNIPPFNLSEVADATIKLLKNPQAKIHLVPDSPTGCDIIEMNENMFLMQSSYELDHINYVITINNTPYMHFLDDIDERLRQIQLSNNPIKEIISADDESNLIEEQFKYVIRCVPCNLNNVVNTLFSRVAGFRGSLSTRNMVVVDKFQTHYYDTRQILLAWVRTRLVGKREWLLRELVAKTSACNMLDGKAFMLSEANLEKTIQVFRSCKSKADIIPALVKAYEGQVTSSQADYISELKIYSLTSGEYDKTLEDIKAIQSDIEKIRGLIEDPELIRQEVINEIKDIKAKYGVPRKSRILNRANNETDVVSVVQILVDGSFVFSETENPEHLSSDITPVCGDVLLVDELSHFIWICTDKVQTGSQMTMTSVGNKNVNYGKCIFATANQSSLIILLTNTGRIKCMPVSSIGISRKPLMSLYEDEYIVSIIESSDVDDELLIYTSDGLGKRILVSDLNNVSSYDAVGQQIVKGYQTAGLFILNRNKPLLCYVTSLGKLRVNQSKYLSTVKKFAEPVPIIKLSPQDTLLSVSCVDKANSIILHHADSRISTVTIDSLDVSTMSAEPIRPKHVPSGKIIRACIGR